MAFANAAWPAVRGQRGVWRLSRWRDELTDARPYSRIVVEGPHPDPDRIGVTGIATEERRATVAAEPFLAPVFGLPHAQPVLARNDPKRAGCGMRVRRRRRAATTLAAPAMAIAGDEKRFGYLEAHGPAVAATREREAIQCCSPGSDGSNEDLLAR